MTRLANTPAIFLESNRGLFHDGIKGEAVVALTARRGLDKLDGREASVAILDAPGGRELMRVYGTVEGLAALGTALVDIAAMVAAAPLDADNTQRADIIVAVDDDAPAGAEASVTD